MKQVLFFAHNLNTANLSTLASERTGLFVQILCLLALIVVGSFLFAQLRGRSLKRKRGIKHQKKLEILETKVLGNRQFLCVVAYEKQRILLGTSPNGLQFLCSLESDKEQTTSNKNL
jgi:flagellar biogenesis protein FliO